MARSSSGDEDPQSLVQRIVTNVLAPIHVAKSKPALKAYLSTVLFLAASILLLATSTTAYLLFYYYFIPQLGLSRLLHLQYADGPFPYSTTYLTSHPSTTTSSLTSSQPYDVLINLHLPRTPTNLAAGNFMLDLSLFSPPSATDQHLSVSATRTSGNTTTLLAHSRRPAILPYQSTITSLTHTFLTLPLHTLSLRDIDATTLTIPMFDQAIFARGWRNLPASARLEIQTHPHIQSPQFGQSPNPLQHVPLQVYSASIEFHARFRGLRWLMYNWRILSFLAFTGAFYCVALVSTGVAWGLLTLLAPTSPVAKKEDDERKKIKNEADHGMHPESTNGHATQPFKTEPRDEDGVESGEESGLSLSNLSENATTFPTLGRQMPLRYPMQQQSSPSGSSRVKEEELFGDSATRIEGTNATEPLHTTTAGEFAEDEAEEDDVDRGRNRDWDSGLGTSMEEGARSVAGLQRRRGRAESSRSGTGTGTGGSGARR